MAVMNRSTASEPTSGAKAQAREASPAAKSKNVARRSLP